MGLAAGQARLLSITGRKSDCEFESMRLSHQKIALARELADLSNEYQDSLEKTKLVYDYYGTGDTGTPLSYSTLMTPSTLNDYKPTLLTDSLGRVTLNDKYAAAARAAGIPQEGLGTLPSETVRNNFVAALSGADLITEDLASKILSLPYNQSTGFGGGTTVAVETESGTYNDFVKFLKTQSANIGINLSGISFDGDSKDNYYMELFCDGTSTSKVTPKEPNDSTKLYDLGKILSGETELVVVSRSKNKFSATELESVTGIVGDILDQVSDYFSSYFDIGDEYTAMALEYARSAVDSMCISDNELSMDQLKIQNITGKAGDISGTLPASKVDWKDAAKFTKPAGEYMGWIGAKKGGMKIALNLNNVVQAYLTYFVDFMNGISATDLYGNQIFECNPGKLNEQTLLRDNNKYQLNWVTGKAVSSDDLMLATFYDTLFNKICISGWTQNSNIENTEYLQQMLQSGMLYISKAKDDNYYYQGNYATDPYIKEIADDTYIAQAEANYNTEKAKLNAKEETLDLKMKNLDTEITSLTTEYDTIKNTISKNIEKSFKRYSA